MRRIIGLLLIAVGAFALVLGLAMPLYAYPSLARLERGGPVIKSEAEGSNMTVWDPRAINDPKLPVQRTGVSVVANRTVKGLVSAAEAKPHGDVAVWEVGLVLMDSNNSNPQEPISVVEDKVCVDRRTNAAVQPCSDEYVTDSGRAPDYQEFRGNHRGQMYKFPFGTEKKDYLYFDTTLRDAPRAEYIKEEQINGLTVYRFEQVIPRTKIEEREVPGRLLQLPDQPSLLVHRYFETKRTMWVEPETGLIVKGSEEIRQTLEDPNSGNTLTLIAGTLELNNDTVKKNLTRASDGAAKLRMLRVTAPWVLGVGGGVALVIGIVLVAVRRRQSDLVFRDE